MKRVDRAKADLQWHASALRNRLVRLGMDTANVADDLLTQMYHNSKRPAPAAMEARVPVSTPAKPTES